MISVDFTLKRFLSFFLSSAQMTRISQLFQPDGKDLPKRLVKSETNIRVMTTLRMTAVLRFKNPFSHSQKPPFRIATHRTFLKLVSAVFYQILIF